MKAHALGAVVMDWRGSKSATGERLRGLFARTDGMSLLASGCLRKSEVWQAQSACWDSAAKRSEGSSGVIGMRSARQSARVGRRPPANRWVTVGVGCGPPAHFHADPSHRLPTEVRTRSVLDLRAGDEERHAPRNCAPGELGEDMSDSQPAQSRQTCVRDETT